MKRVVLKTMTNERGERIEICERTFDVMVASDAPKGILDVITWFKCVLEEWPSAVLPMPVTFGFCGGEVLWFVGEHGYTKI